MRTIIPSDPAIPLLDLKREETKLSSQRDSVPHVHHSVIHESQDRNSLSVCHPVTRTRYTYTTEHHSLQQEESPPCATPWMELEGIALSETNQSKTKTV